MNKLKVIGLGLLALLLVGGTAYAATPPGFWDVVASKVAVILAGKIQAPAKITEPQQNLGAVTGPDLPNPTCQNNNCTYTAYQANQTGTTTIFSIPDPFLMVTTSVSDVVLQGNFTGATTTVELARINITTGATSSFRLACGASASPTGVLGTAMVPTIVSTTPALAGDSIATSSVGLIENNLTGAQGALIDSGTVAKIAVGPATPYLVCTVGAVNNAAFTNGSEAFSAKGVFKFSRTRF